MKKKESTKSKMYYSTSEIAKLLGVDTQTIYYWEREYKILPDRTATNIKRFTPEQVESLKTIYYLVRERRMAGEGVKKILANPDAFSAEENKRKVLDALKRAKAITDEIVATVKKYKCFRAPLPNQE